MTGTTLDRPTPTSVSTPVEPRTGAHAVARTLADTTADAAPAVRTPSRPCPHAAAAAEQARRDGECVAFFVALVTAAVVILGLSLFTQVEGLPRLLVTAASGLLAGAVTWSVTQPVLEDEVLHG